MNHRVEFSSPWWGQADSDEFGLPFRGNSPICGHADTWCEEGSAQVSRATTIGRSFECCVTCGVYRGIGFAAMIEVTNPSPAFYGVGGARISAQDGAIFIPATQPLARLAFYLVEAESDDGFVNWNLMDAGLAIGEAYPIYRVMDTKGLRLLD